MACQVAMMERVNSKERMLYNTAVIAGGPQRVLSTGPTLMEMKCAVVYNKKVSLK